MLRNERCFWRFPWCYGNGIRWRGMLVVLHQVLCRRVVRCFFVALNYWARDCSRRSVYSGENFEDYLFIIGLVGVGKFFETVFLWRWKTAQRPKILNLGEEGGGVYWQALMRALAYNLKMLEYFIIYSVSKPTCLVYENSC